MEQQMVLEANESKYKYWDKLYSGDLTKLPWITNPYPVDLFQHFVNQLKNSDNILDYGAGIGRYVNLLKKTGALITCVDISKRAIKICKENNPDSIAIPSGTPQNLEDDLFNGVFCWGVLHHINPDEREDFWNNLRDKIKNKGLILLGGWSTDDIEHISRSRISSVTLHQTWDIDTDLPQTVQKSDLRIIDQGQYVFQEAYTNKNRLFSHYLIQKV